jgi:hypothetical protein
MPHYLVYHNAEKMGHSYREDDDRPVHPAAGGPLPDPGGPGGVPDRVPGGKG